MIKVCVIGLGYVGLPICLKLSSYFNTVGFDNNKKRIDQLKNKIDENNEYQKKDFLKKKILFSCKINDIKSCNIFIICVPTPIKISKLPDLKFVSQSFDLISSVLKQGDSIILESTVYPGVTKKFTKKLELKTKLLDNKDFFTCYSPERINPGDKNNELSKINKILAYRGNNSLIKNRLEKVYSKISKKIIFTNKIEEAEAAKGIENIQRDLNISLFNEILLICRKLNLNFNEVIRLADTKWNFIKFSPGLVGGHCLPVYRYYLSFAANEKKYKSKVTLAGRYVNEYMKQYVLNFVSEKIKKSSNNKKKLNICLIGLTYKYGVSDTRNSQNIEIFNSLKIKFKKIKAYDPFIKNKKFRNINDLKNNDFYIFLSKGIEFKKICKKVKDSKIIDPFCYYTN